MPRAVFRFGYIWALYLFAAGISRAQVAIPLQLKPDRMRHASEVKQQALASHDTLLLAEAWYLYGKTYVFAGDYRTAQAYFMKSLRIHEPRGDSFELSRLYVRLSENEGRLGRPTESLRLAQLALAIAQRIQSAKALIRAYGALGRVYESMWDGQLAGHQREYERIHAMYKKREALSRSQNDTLGIAEVSMELGTLYTRVKDPQAIPYLKKALALFTKLNEAGVIVRARVRLAAAYLVADKPQLAYQSLQKADALYNDQKLNEYDIRLLLEETYVRYFRFLGQWEPAFEHLEKLNRLERSQLLADNNGAITRLNIEYDTEKKETLLKAQDRELALRAETLRTHQLFITAMLVLLVMAVGMSILFFRLSRRNQRISRRNVELVKEQNHRVKNNLQVVTSLLSLQAKRLTDDVAKKAVEESRLRVQSMAILHRRLYDGDKLAEASLDAFIREVVSEVLKAYGYTTIQPRFFIDDVTLSADKAVPLGLIVNELTTNACKYAFPNTDNPQFSVRCYRKQHRIRVVVADNGPGLEGPGQEPSGLAGAGVETIPATVPVSFGMQLIQAQVRQLAGTYTFSVDEGAESAGVVFIMEFKG